MLTSAAKIFGLVFIAIGVMGFISGLTPDDELLGIFHVDPLHNVIHLTSGAVALWAGYATPRASKMYFQIFGVVYALVTVLGFIYGDDDILGILANNTADNILHLLIAASALILGFGSFDKEPVTAREQ